MAQYPQVFQHSRRLLQGGDYNPDQWLHDPEIFQRDLELMEKSGCNTFSIGIFAWAMLEPAPGEFHFEWLDKVMDAMAEKGFHVILATPSGAKPAWMARRHPEICRVLRDGQREPWRARHNHCWSSPAYREYVRRINSKLAQRYANHPALVAWHLSNEYGGACYCPLCQERFRDFLRQRYGTLEALNRAWCNHFWSHLIYDWQEITPWVDSCGCQIDWRRFTTWQCRDFIQMEKEAVQQYTPNIPAGINMMGFFDGLDYWRIAEVCDYISDDCYPEWGTQPDVTALMSYLSMRHDMHRAMKGGRPFIVMESSPSGTNWQEIHRLKRPNSLMLEELMGIGHGADGTLFFQWRKSQGNSEKFHGAVVDHVGHENTRVFQDVKAIGDLYKKCGDIVGAGLDVQAAVIFDWDCSWSFSCNSGPSALPHKRYEETVSHHYQSLWENNIHTDVIESACDFSKYKLLIAPMMIMLKPGVADRLKEFVRNGGTLLMTYLSGYENESSNCILGGWPGDGLMELFGIWNEEIGGLADFDRIAVSYNGKDWPVADYAERIHLKGATCLAEFRADDFYRGMPALTCNNFGKGKAYYLAARLPQEFLNQLTLQLAKEAAIPSVLANAPKGIHATLRQGDFGSFLFLYNCNSAPITVQLPQGTWQNMDGQALDQSLELPALGSCICRLKQ